jgi:septum formation protein
MPASKKIILASTSPRRIELLKQLGISFEVISPNADETPKKNETPSALVSRLALDKARSIRSKSAIIIAADTIVVDPSGKKILGKPRSKPEAEKMLRMLQAATHTVLTGYCLLEGSHSRVKVVRSRVKMRALSARQIRAYVATGEPMDKAGSYAAQGRGMALIEKINGSYANVVGLPICQVVQDLGEHFGVQVLG